MSLENLVSPIKKFSRKYKGFLRDARNTFIATSLNSLPFAASSLMSGCGSETTGPTQETPIEDPQNPVERYAISGTTNASGSFTVTDPDNGQLTINVKDMSNGSPVVNAQVAYERIDNSQGHQFRFITAFPQGVTNVRPNTLVIPLNSLNLREASQSSVTINLSNYVQGIPPSLTNFIEERYGLDKQTIEDFLEYELGKVIGCASYPGYIGTFSSQEQINVLRGESKIAMAIIKSNGGGDYELKVLSTLSDKLENPDIQSFLGSIGALDNKWDLYTLDPLKGIFGVRNRWFDFVLPSQAPTGSITDLTVSGTNVNATVEATDKRYYSGTRVLDPTSTCIDGNNTMDIVVKSNIRRPDGTYVVRGEVVGTLRIPIISGHTYETGSLTVPVSNSTLPEGANYNLEFELVDEAGNIGRAGTRTFSVINPEFVSLNLEGLLQTPAIPSGIARATETFYTIRRDAFSNLTVVERFTGPPPGPVSQTFTMPETSVLGVRGVANDGYNVYLMNVDRDIIATNISGSNLIEWTRWPSIRSQFGSNSDANIFMGSDNHLIEVYLAGSEIRAQDWGAANNFLLPTPETTGERFPSGAIDPTNGNLYLGFTVPGAGNYISRYTKSGSSFVHEDTRKVPSELIGLTGLVTTEDGKLHALSAANKLYEVTF